MSQLQVTGEAKIRDIQGPVVANSGVVTALDGDASQYVRGDGTLADFPTSTGGGSSVSYYLNSSVSQGTIGGVAYRQLGKTPIAGAGTDITTSTNGYVASYLTDANDPALLEVPAGNFNCEFYFSVNSDAHNPFVYAEVYKYDGTTFTLIGSSQSVPEYLTNGTTLSPYYFAIPVAQTVLAITDRIAIRIYVNVDGRTVTLHTENNHLCQVVTTFSKGLTSLNNLTRQVQFLATGTSGTDFNISSSTATHTFNIPDASATNRGLITTGIQTIAGSKTFSSAITGDSGIALKEGVIPSAVGYTGLAGDADGLLITKRVGSTGYTNLLYFNSATSNTYTFPNASGTLALTSNLSSYVPYTGATANVDLGNFNFDANGISGGSIIAKLNGPASSPFVLKTGSSGYTIGDDAISLVSSPTTANTLILASNIGVVTKTAQIGLGSLSATRTFTLPDITGTLALLEGTQTFSGAKTFSLDILVNGLTVGRGAGSVSTNTVLGLASFATNTTGTYNVAIGQSALNSNTTGGYNTAVGGSAMVANSTGSFNTAIGTISLNYNTTGTNNTALGYSSLSANTTGSSNVAVGSSALLSNTTAINNTAIGNAALSLNTTGTGNTAIGQSAGFSITTGSNNTIIGSYAGTAAMSNNIVLADGAGNIRYQWNGTNNVFGNPISGTSATFSGNISITKDNPKLILNDNAGGSQNNYSISSNFGFFNLNDETASGASVMSYGGGLFNFIGAATFSSSVTAQNDGAFYRLKRTSGTDLGYITDSTTWGASGTDFAIGASSANMVFYTNNSVAERMRITSGGNVGIGTSSPATKLDVSGTIRSISQTDPTSGVGMELFYRAADTSSYIQSYDRTNGAWKDVRIYGNTLYFGSQGTNNLTIASTGAATFSSSVSGTSIRSSAVGSFGFNTANNGEFQIYGTATDGMLIAGRGSTNDLVLLNKNGSDVLRVPTGTTTVSLQSLTGSGSRAVLADASGNLSAPVSDISVKENIKPIEYGLNEVLKMNPVWFDFIDEYKNYGQGRQNGNIAQEMEAIIPEAVFTTPSTGKMGINYDQLHAVYIKAIQELEARIKQLENK